MIDLFYKPGIWRERTEYNLSFLITHLIQSSIFDSSLQKGSRNQRKILSIKISSCFFFLQNDRFRPPKLWRDFWRRDNFKKD